MRETNTQLNMLTNDVMKKDLLLGEQTVFGIKGNSIDRSKLVLHDIPARIKDEIPTLNQFGYMKEELDEYSRDFLEYASKTDKPVLEIGTAYGWVALQALERGATLIANDVSEEHLSILLHNTPEDDLNKLFLIPETFPQQVNLPDASVSAVLASRIFHFLDGIEIEKGLEKIYNFLIIGGKFYFTACSYYHYSVKEKMLNTFNEGISQGIKWPGLILNQRASAPDHAPYVQELLNVFDIPQLEALLPKHGFIIDRISLFDYPNDTDSKGKGHVGFVATKV